MASYSEQRRLLVITYHFPPDGAIGGFRWAGFTRYLAELGWEVHVVTAAAGAENGSVPGVHVHVAPRRTTLNDRYKAAAARLRPVTAAAVTAAKQPGQEPDHPPSAIARAVFALRRGVGGSLYFPDHARGWIGRATGVARALLRAKKFDLVITSGPPHSVHFAGVFATRGSNVPLWVDMRDPWTVQLSHDADGNPHKTPSFISRLEQYVFRRAHKVVVNTAEFAEALRRTEPTLDISYIPNGINSEHLPARTDQRFAGCSIVYVGTLYANRNLTSVLAAMGAIMRDNAAGPAALRLRIAGPMDAHHRSTFESDLARDGMSAYVENLGVVPRAKALDLLVRSHLALVLAQDQPMCVPAKLYECLGLGVPTLVIAENTSASAREGRRVGAIVMEPHDVQGIRGVIEDALAGRLPATVVPIAPIAYADLATDLDRLIRTELKMAGRGSGGGGA